ncbi:hypothetical protein [Rhodopila sp.]|uniref:hypothetical protein n=1 Tax=Rhodopila sp. TaxID=2480087 RepID=UPI003D10C22F
MTPATQMLCSMALTFGMPIVIAGAELWRLGPSPRHLPPGGESPEPTPQAPDTGVAPIMSKPLPSCLIPQASRTRVREPA